MRWSDLPGSELMSRVYSTVPEISEVSLMRLSLELIDGKAMIDFDLTSNLPDKAPVKWGANYNRCRIGLGCYVVSQFSMTGDFHSCNGTLNVSHRNECYFVIFSSEIINFSFECKVIHVTGPSVYISC